MGSEVALRLPPHPGVVPRRVRGAKPAPPSAPLWIHRPWSCMQQPRRLGEPHRSAGKGQGATCPHRRRSASRAGRRCRRLAACSNPLRPALAPAASLPALPARRKCSGASPGHFRYRVSLRSGPVWPAPAAAPIFRPLTTTGDAIEPDLRTPWRFCGLFAVLTRENARYFLVWSRPLPLWPPPLAARPPAPDKLPPICFANAPPPPKPADAHRLFGLRKPARQS
jgi:hypothetical protein